MFKKIFLASAVILLLVLNACSDSPTSIGTDLMDQDFIDVQQFTSDSIAQSTVVQQKAIALGSSLRLMLGRTGNAESGIFVNFLLSMPDSVKSKISHDSLIVESAKVEFIRDGYSLGDSTAPFGFTAHSINTTWTSSGFTGDSLNSSVYDAADRASNISLTDSILTFNLDNSLVTSWLLAEADTNIAPDNGIYLKPTQGTSRVAGFYALSPYSSTNEPLIYVATVDKKGVKDTLTFGITSDLSVVTGTMPSLGQENIAVQGGLELMTKLKMDISSLTETNIINKAELVLIMDTLASVTGTGYTNSITANFIVDSTNDSTTTSITMSRDGNKFTGNITSFIQNWTTNGVNNGILLKSNDEYDGLDLFILKGSNASDPALRPYLKILYTKRK